MIKSASVDEAHEWLRTGEAVIVDVREPFEYEQAHISGAFLLPLSTVSLNALPDFKGKRLVMQCHLGGRSQTACNKLLAEKPDLEVYNLEGGIHAWTLAGLTVEA